MARRKRRYTPEFKAEAVRLVVEENVSPAQAARDLSVPESTLARWVQRHQQNNDPDGPPSSQERREIRELKKKLQRAEMERDILKKALAFFAQDDL